MRTDDREDQVLCVLSVVDDDVTGQVHHRDHHAHRREPGKERWDYARAADDLAQWSRRRGRSLLPAGDQLGDALRVGPNAERDPHRDEGDHAGGKPRDREHTRCELVLAREDRAEDGGTEDGAEDGADEHVRDSPRASRRWVHVAGGSPDEQRDARGGADQREARDDGKS
ncbi:MAG TPA: hypothetical protein VJL85_07695 [Gaiellaceae bacterium]|nr:hypothetical protein [Gaiellaceae bacterium]